MLAASGMLGYGFTEAAFENVLAGGIDVIGCDGGSMDPGPYYLGSGTPFVSRRAMKRDLALLLEAGVRGGIPVIIGSAGGGGGAPHVAYTRAMVDEIAAERGLAFDMAVIHSEQEQGRLRAAVRDGRVRPLGPIGELEEATIAGTTRVVAMMGVEPLQAALAGGAQVVVAGRCSDAAIYAAAPIARGYDPGLAWHLGKIIECAGQVVEPRTGQDCVVGTLAADHFLVEPGHPDKRCTRMRIAAHTLYENPSPYLLTEPGGTLDTRACTYEQVDPRRVRVSGSVFTPAPEYTVKLEGVSALGFRTVFVAGVRDPDLVAGIDDFVAACRERVAGEARALGVDPQSYTLTVRVYGRDAVMGAREPVREPLGHEIGIVADVIAPDEDTSRAIMAKARYALLHTDFPHRKCISGNLAIPFSPSDLPAGQAYRFSVWHVMALDDPLEPFPIEMVRVGR
ncbi:MAG: acyclic terpene utilization AtuA family protein [Ectothiorhodospiraceae bacterium]|nr:acyclic terpene utilization AtuA family protein [Ectothiorhodospiraceae bacterium]